jgi:hypothetical protein
MQTLANGYRTCAGAPWDEGVLRAADVTNADFRLTQFRIGGATCLMRRRQFTLRKETRQCRCLQTAVLVESGLLWRLPTTVLTAEGKPVVRR